MRTRRLEISCPLCGSAEVAYTCTPNCCFNHVCAGCGATFEPVTRATGRVLKGIEPPDPLPEASDPTVACARCESTEVYLTQENAAVCAKCGAVLEVELTEIHR
jgi:hypothetical protein